MKKFHTILLVLGIALLACLLWKIGVGELWRELGVLGWGLAPLMLGEGLAEMIHTLGWRHCLSGSLRSLPWFTLFRIRMAGYAFNYLTPTAALGGEVTKGALLAAHEARQDAASGVLIGKLCFALAHLIFVSCGAILVLWEVNLPRPVWVAMVICGGLLGTGIVSFLLLQKHGKLGTLVRWLAANKPDDHPLQKAAREITAVDEAMMRFHHERPRDLLQAIGWHLVGYTIGIGQTWLFFRLLHNDASWAVAAGMWFLGMWFDLLTFAVPLNLGTLEGTRILAFQSAGYTALIGMTYGLALRLAQICWTVFGLISHAMLARRSVSAEKAIPAATTSEALCAKASNSPALAETNTSRPGSAKQSTGAESAPAVSSAHAHAPVPSDSARVRKSPPLPREQPLKQAFKTSTST
jgi:uncharacterized protein (TIRG00374 family)